MNLAKVSAMRQITIPMDICKLLKIKPGLKVLFTEKANGEVIIRNASIEALDEAERNFRGAAKEAGFKTEDDIMQAVREVRYGMEAQ